MKPIFMKTERGYINLSYLKRMYIGKIIDNNAATWAMYFDFDNQIGLVIETYESQKEAETAYRYMGEILGDY